MTNDSINYIQKANEFRKELFMELNNDLLEWLNSRDNYGNDKDSYNDDED